MTTLIANHTIHGQRLIHEADPRKPADKDRYEPAMVPPGQPFDPAKLGIGAEEARALVASGAARERGKLEAAEASAATDVARHPPLDTDELPSVEALEKMSRADLDVLGAGRGLDPAKAANKAEMIEMLLNAAD